MDWFTSDLHLGFTSMLKHRERFSSMEEMNNTIISNILKCVKKGDRLFILGDLAYDKELAKQIIEPVTSRKAHVFWIRGNHDHNTIWDSFKPSEYKGYLHMSDTFEVKAQASNGYGSLFLCHYPCTIWNKSHYNGYHLYGHSHKDTSDVPYTKAIMQGKCLNVNVELHDYKPWNRDEVEKYMESRPSNLDYYLCKGLKKQKRQAIRVAKKVEKLLKRFYDKQKKEDQKQTAEK